MIVAGQVEWHLQNRVIENVRSNAEVNSCSTVDQGMIVIAVPLSRHSTIAYYFHEERSSSLTARPAIPVG
jgi:hypothetical protein